MTSNIFVESDILGRKVGELVGISSTNCSEIGLADTDAIIDGLDGLVCLLEDGAEMPLNFEKTLSVFVDRLRIAQVRNWAEHRNAATERRKPTEGEKPGDGAIYEMLAMAAEPNKDRKWCERAREIGRALEDACSSDQNLLPYLEAWQELVKGVFVTLAENQSI